MTTKYECPQCQSTAPLTEDGLCPDCRCDERTRKALTTTATTQKTPTPWQLNLPCTDEIIADYGGKDISIARGLTKANAQLILTAVNNHELMKGLLYAWLDIERDAHSEVQAHDIGGCNFCETQKLLEDLDEN